MFVVFYPTANTITNLTDSKANTYTLVYNRSSGTCNTESAVSIYYASITTGGTSAKTTATFNAAVTVTGINCHELSKLATTPLDSANMSGTSAYYV